MSEIEMEGKIKELLAVLDMTEEEQWQWVDNNGLFHFRKPPNEVECSCKAFISVDESLADLAFRLRDEAYKGHTFTMWRATLEVYCYTENKSRQQYFDSFARGYNYDICLNWFAMFAKPIHWIIAALIAKQLESEGKDE